MFLKIIGIFAEFERENIGERVRLGKERKAKEGWTTASPNVSYGYDRANGEKVQTINPKEAAVVRRIYDMYVNENLSLTKITATLNQEKIPSKKGHTWNTGTIINLIKNPNYIGNVRYAKDSPERYFEAEGKHEAIISEDLFEDAQQRLENNKSISPTRQPSADNYLAGLIYCGVCGTKAVTNITKGKGHTKQAKYSYTCRGRVNKACDAKKISMIKLEKTLVEYIANIPNLIIDTATAEQAKHEAAARVIALQEKLTTLDAKEKEMLDFYIEESASFADYRGVKAKLDIERVEIRAEIESLMPPEKPTYKGALTKEEIIAAFRKSWGKFTLLEKRQFLLKYIRKITVINHPVPGSNYGRCEIMGIDFNAE